MSLQPTLDFLAALRENNEKEWFDDHRDAYDEARAAFENLLAEVIAGFTQIDDFGMLSPKDTMFRINRDVRFSNDKSPYKTSMSALIGPQGRKSTSNYYYISVEPGDQSMVATGLKSPGAKMLKQVREAIAEDARPLREILADASFVAMFGALDGDQLKTAPKGFDKDHPDVDLLRYKEYMAQRAFTDEAVAQDDFAEQVLVTCRAAKPLTHYLHSLVVSS